MYKNTLSPSEISDMLMSIANSIWQESKRHKECEHNENLQEAYRMVCKVASQIDWYILGLKQCELK